MAELAFPLDAQILVEAAALLQDSRDVALADIADSLQDSRNGQAADVEWEDMMVAVPVLQMHWHLSLQGNGVSKRQLSLLHCRTLPCDPRATTYLSRM